MSIDMNINELFSEKNQELFFNKLIMDLDNNMDTFKLVTKNIVMIEVAKLLSSLKKIYIKYSIDIDDSQLKKLLGNTKNELLETATIVIEDKYLMNKKYIEENQKSSVTKSYLKNYQDHIDNSEKSFEDSLNLGIKEVTEINFYNSLVSIYPCSNEEMQFDLLDAVNIQFTNNLINRISEESKHRNRTLKNISDETYTKYLEIRKKSNNIPKQSKVKIKKDN